MYHVILYNCVRIILAVVTERTWQIQKHVNNLILKQLVMPLLQATVFLSVYLLTF